jgi:hypothetical protein
VQVVVALLLCARVVPLFGVELEPADVPQRVPPGRGGSRQEFE